MGEAVAASRSTLRGLGATGGKRKSGVARLRSRDVEGAEEAATVLCDRFRFMGGSLAVDCSGEEEDRTIGGLSTAEEIGEGCGISISGIPRFGLTSR